MDAKNDYWSVKLAVDPTINHIYTNIEWELLAVVFGCKKFQTYM